jgi:hypothetical protein
MEPVVILSGAKRQMEKWRLPHSEVEEPVEVPVSSKRFSAD